MNDTAEDTLTSKVRRLVRTIRFLNDSEGGNFTLLGPSRNLVIRENDLKSVVKSYVDRQRWEAEHLNLEVFHLINKERTEPYREITNSDKQYLGLPEIDRSLPRIHLFTPVQGDLLYEKMKTGTATTEDILLAVTQIARIQQEGKSYRDQLSLKSIVEVDAGLTYYLDRFRNVFLKQLMSYGGLDIPQHLQEEMTNDWEILVSKNLASTRHRGFTGYYYDGNPRNHILTSDGKGIVSFDYEDRLIAPSLLSFASLLSFGLDERTKTYPEQQETYFKFLDRALLETIFSEALQSNRKEQADRIHKYLAERKEVYNFDLSGPKSDEFFRFISRVDDRGVGVRRREDILSTLPYALLEKNAAWIGYKAFYKAINELLAHEGIKFENEEDILRQNTKEQKQHLENIDTILDAIINNPRTVIYQGHAAQRLRHRFQELADNRYFSPN